MADYGGKGGFAKYWVIAILIVCLLQGAISFLLFTVQSKNLVEVEARYEYLDQFAEERMRVIQEGAERFAELKALIIRASEMFAQLIVVKEGLPVDSMMVAVDESSNPLPVKIIEIIPVPPVEGMPLPTTNWRIRSSGEYADILVFINNLEQRGIVFDAGNFSVRTVREGGVELTAVMKVATRESLEKAAEDAERLRAEAETRARQADAAARR